MGRQIVTLYIQDTALQLLVTSGKRIKKWARVTLEPGLVKGALVTNEVEVARGIRDMLEANQVKSRKVIVGLSGLHSLTRPMTFPLMPRTNLAEAVLIEARKVLPVPLDQLYVSWRSTTLPGKKLQVFVAAIPRKTVDAMVATLLRAGLRAQLLDLKPLALARLVRDKTAIIVDVQSSEFDIVVMAKGIPQPIRTLPLSGGTVAERLKTIGDEVHRTVEFYNSSNAPRALDPSAPLYVGGELAGEPELSKELSGRIGRPFLILLSPIPTRELPDPNTYLVNIGLTLKELSSIKGGASAAVNLNALPEAYREKPISLARAVALPVTVGAAALIIPMVTLLQDASTDVSSMGSQLTSANQSLSQRQKEEQALKKDIAALEKKVTKTEAPDGNLVSAFNGLKTSADRINGDLQAVMNIMSGDLGLQQVNYGKGMMTIKGRLPTRADVLDYARKLDHTARFPEVIIASMVKVENKATGEAVEFTINLSGW